ncbi:MAG: porin [Candidatus Eisenbacteria bacterium]|nr:porin [Candidatus Eisenbacteria bacterium]
MNLVAKLVPGLAATAALAFVTASAAATTVTFDGQFRTRWEYREPLDYRLPGSNGRAALESLSDRGDAAAMRARLGARLALDSGVRAYVQLQDARVMGSESAVTANTNNVDLHQAWLDVDSLGGHDLSLRTGRMELSYGDQHLLGAADWTANGRSFDGARLRWKPGKMQIDGFVTWVNEGRRQGQDRIFGGLYAVLRPAAGLEVEPFALLRDYGDTNFTAVGTGHKAGLHDRTLGARARFTKGRLDVRAEAMLQSGTRSTDQVRAHAGSAKATFELEPKHSVKLSGEFMLATGDDTPDGTHRRYDPLFPTGHVMLGYADVIGLSNVRALALGLSFSPSKPWAVQLDAHQFTLAEAKDVWVDASGTTLRRRADGSAGDELGLEGDLTVRWTARPGLQVVGGLSRFVAGDFVTSTGGGGDATWGFLQLLASF